jgi:NADPH:quinone reductase-like Zn-dependent oxidoreductase
MTAASSVLGKIINRLL